MSGAIITASVSVLLAFLYRVFESQKQRMEKRIGLYADWVKSVRIVAGITSVRDVPVGEIAIADWKMKHYAVWEAQGHLYEQLLLIGKVETVLAAQRVITALREADRIKLAIIEKNPSDLAYLGEVDAYNNYPHTALIFTLLSDFADEVRDETRNKKIPIEDLLAARTLSEVKLAGEQSRHLKSLPSRIDGE
jgi:hypothetical protein